MAQVGTRERGADAAVAARVEWAVVAHEGGPLDRKRPWAGAGLQSASGRSSGAYQRRPRLRLVSRIWRAFVERHHQVGAKFLLNVDGALGREHHGRTVEMRTEADSVRADRIDFGEAHRLE